MVQIAHAQPTELETVEIMLDEYRALIEDHARYTLLRDLLLNSAGLSYSDDLQISSDRFSDIIKALFPALYAETVARLKGANDGAN